MQKVQRLTDEAVAFAAHCGLDERLQEVLSVTEAMYSSPVAADVECDPEWPDESYLVLTVAASGLPKELLDRECRWHERISRLIPDCANRLRLCVDVQ